MDLLRKGLNFSIFPKTPKEDLFVDIESNLIYIDQNQKSATDVLEALKHYDLVYKKHNNHSKTIKSLKEKNVFYLKADKSNTIVVIDKNDYYKRVQEMLDEGPYQICTKNPLNSYILSVSSTLKQCKNLVNPKLATNLHVSNPTIPRLYCLPKTHKPGNKMRPIVSSINSPTYLLSKCL